MIDKNSCAYCSEKLKEGDDIVVCPDCGARYHRACWDEHGRCAFEHRSTPEAESVDDSAVESVNNESETEETEDFIGQVLNRYVKQNGEDVTNRCEACGRVLPKGVKTCLYCGHIQGAKSDDDNAKKAEFNAVNGIEYDEEIAGKKAGEIALVVKRNIPKFLPKFKKIDSRKIKISWSWPAFLFGYLYLFFRKMYKYGIIFIFAMVLLANVINTAAGDPVGNMLKKTQDIYGKYAYAVDSGDAESEKAYAEMEKALTEAFTQNNLIYKVYAVLLSSILCANIVAALLCNYLYLRHCVATIDRMKKSADVLGGMSDGELKFNLLARGGVSIFGIVLGYMANRALSFLFSQIVSLFK